MAFREIGRFILKKFALNSDFHASVYTLYIYDLFNEYIMHM